MLNQKKFECSHLVGHTNIYMGEKNKKQGCLWKSDPEQKLQTMIYKDNRGFVIRSRFKENLEVEWASLYHINREENGPVGNLESLMIDRRVETDRKKVEPAVSFF